MAITQSQTKAPASVYNHAQGRYLDDAGTPDAMEIDLGFMPRYIKVINETDRTVVEWYYGMAATNSLKTAADGVMTLATDSAILVADNAFTFLKALTVQNKQYQWVALN